MSAEKSLLSGRCYNGKSLHSACAYCVVRFAAKLKVMLGIFAEVVIKSKHFLENKFKFFKFWVEIFTGLTSSVNEKYQKSAYFSKLGSKLCVDSNY